MSEQTSLLQQMRIATPCPTSWESMEGDERVRFCHLCNLNVYNIAALTPAEAEALVAGAEGRLCARLYRRADGTVLTKDCPTGLRAVRRRVSRGTAALFAALVSLCAPAFGQTRGEKIACAGGGQIELQKKTGKDARPGLSGIVIDPLGATVADAEVSLTEEITGKKLSVRTNEKGEFAFADLPAGAYTFEVVTPGFPRLAVEHFTLAEGDSLTIQATLVLGEPLTGVINVEISPSSDFESGGGKTVFRGRMLTDLPIPR